MNTDKNASNFGRRQEPESFQFLESVYHEESWGSPHMKSAAEAVRGPLAARSTKSA